ncbi:MAG: DUF6174 domain-containing protein [Longimicrobiales bacterium]|nr:DUF6174 domain-containing protein [Longimicrobiales bacterium]
MASPDGTLMCKEIHLKRLALVLAVGVGSSACDSVGLRGGPESQLEENQAQWASLSLTSYEYVLRRGCFCSPAFIGPVRVRVEGGAVTRRTYVELMEPVPTEPGQGFPSVGGLFDIIARAYEQDAHRVVVTYDVESGVPLDVFIDFEANIADEELSFTIEVLPVPLP